MRASAASTRPGKLCTPGLAGIPGSGVLEISVALATGGCRGMAPRACGESRVRALWTGLEGPVSPRGLEVTDPSAQCTALCPDERQAAHEAATQQRANRPRFFRSMVRGLEALRAGSGDRGKRNARHAGGRVHAHLAPQRRLEAGRSAPGPRRRSGLNRPRGPDRHRLVQAPLVRTLESRRISLARAQAVEPIGDSSRSWAPSNVPEGRAPTRGISACSAQRRCLPQLGMNRRG